MLVLPKPKTTTYGLNSVMLQLDIGTRFQILLGESQAIFLQIRRLLLLLPVFVFM